MDENTVWRLFADKVAEILNRYDETEEEKYRSIEWAFVQTENKLKEIKEADDYELELKLAAVFKD